jgi:hypothetical protein
MPSWNLDGQLKVPTILKAIKCIIALKNQADFPSIPEFNVGV